MPKTETSSDSDDDFTFNADMFVEPEGFRPKTPEVVEQPYGRDLIHVQPGSPATLTIQMIGERHSLWAHKIWNAGVVLARHMDAQKHLVQGKRVLELGCAAALPSLMSSLNGAECVVATDYPDPHLIRTIERNCATNCPEQFERGAIKALGYQWGQDLTPVLNALPDQTRKFDVVHLADVVPVFFTEHRNLLKSCDLAMTQDAVAYVYFTSHVVKFAERDFSFFRVAEEEFGFASERLPDVKASAMFPEDVGDLSVRETVCCFKMWRK
ncbi:nicotinamide n-methyltransferase [Podochytrium sp. JEL0797]|nr:nicotinamide n-methyltransferase [Podochytrium sp. JEL0797]